ncbi:unnamed protein product, partial [Vitis vinifera]
MLFEDMFDSKSPNFKQEFQTAWLQLSSPCLWEDVSIVLQLGFLLSVIHTAFDVHFLVTNNGHLRMQDYTDFLGLLASTCLFGISIRGKTGTVLISQNGLADPLLNGKTDNHSEGKTESPYGKATLFQLITFSWLNPLFAVGIKKPLAQDEIPDVDVKDSAEFTSHYFDECLKHKTRSLESGYLLALAFLSAKTVETIAQRQWIFGARQLGLRLRAALISHIYKKGLVLSSQSRQSHTSGEIINYMGVDIQRMTDFIWYMNTIWMLPIQISLAICVLNMNIGLGIQKRYQSKIMEAKDERMKATSEVLRNIKTLKLQAWDSQFLHKLESLRKIEYNWLWKSLRLGALSAFIFWGSPTFISVVTFGAFASFLQEDERGMKLSGNVKENILFGNRYDSVKYDETVKACALTKDFELFPCGDLTEIGERGINMSGGQKQRIQIARAVYEDADIYLLDDPFSAVDAHTGTQLFKDCLMGILKNKTILYVTHQVEFLPAADFILVMQDGRIAQAGRFEQLLKQNIGFEVLDPHNISLEITEKQGRLTQDEEREKGSIGKEVASNYWMAWASPPTSESRPKMGLDYILFVYILLAVGSSLFVLLRASLVAITGLSTAQKLFVKMLQSVVRAPMAFFDSTPTGRILNRASIDQSVLDMEMANRLGWCAFSVIQILGTIAVMSQVAWEVFVIFIPVTAICIWYQQYYIPTARELGRLASIQQSPILHHFSESLSGAATIRAFDQEDRFIHANLDLVDNFSRPWFHNVSAMEWLSFRLNVLSNFVFAFSLVLLVSLPEGIINPSIAGLAVTYGINLNVLQASVIWNICNAENKMISVERILQYSKIKSEAPLVIEECRPENNWPQVGTICFQNLQIRYAEHLPSVLKNISCTFPGGMKIGVVGRTGSGKSTLIQAIFRIVEPREGSIIIDGVDISKIGLHDLRSRLSIIPQDPAMFEGTVRGNLDPLDQHPDGQVWEALDKCQLGDLVRAKEEKLDSSVVENGENWSVGQRQLVCLGRALLKRSSILVLDEATASVDSATDGVIQKIISQEFKDRTVVTIAHRIHTVIDSDLVLVLSEGRIAEYDTPAKLLERDDSFFSKLIKEYSKRSKGFGKLAIST